MLVQSCLNAFLATVWRLRTAPAPLPESCSTASRLGPRAVRPQRPYRLIVRLSLGPRAARPASRLFVQGPRALRCLINLLRGPRAESLPFVLLHCYITKSLHDCYYVRCHLQVCKGLNEIG